MGLGIREVQTAYVKSRLVPMNIDNRPLLLAAIIRNLSGRGRKASRGRMVADRTVRMTHLWNKYKCSHTHSVGVFLVGFHFLH
jgi:hypothetical protein